MFRAACRRLEVGVVRCTWAQGLGRVTGAEARVKMLGERWAVLCSSLRARL